MGSRGSHSIATFWLIAAGASSLALPARGECIDTERYRALLADYTAEVSDPAGVRVDYAALREAPEWNDLVAGLDACDPEELGPRPERLAFWINAYNILTIDLVTRSYPVESIRDIGSLFRPVWKREAGSIGGRPYSLDEIEHQILRPMDEPRIHAAIVCASTSCPSLRREPYQPSQLDAQLDDSLRRWLQNPHKGARLDVPGKTLTLSRIFDWFEEDFEAQGGVLRYLRPYLPEEMRGFVATENSLRIRHFEYDWSLNDLASRVSPSSRKPREEEPWPSRTSSQMR